MSVKVMGAGGCSANIFNNIIIPSFSIPPTATSSSSNFSSLTIILPSPNAERGGVIPESTIKLPFPLPKNFKTSPIPSNLFRNSNLSPHIHKLPTGNPLGKCLCQILIPLLMSIQIKLCPQKNLIPLHVLSLGPCSQER